MGQPIGMKDLGHLPFLLFRNLDDFAFLAVALFGVMFSVAFGREITTEAHRDRARRNLSQPSRDDDSG